MMVAWIFRKREVIQVSGVGPAFYIITVSDLRPITPGNLMHKYADDTYLEVSCADKIKNVEKWTEENNSLLNHTKSV